jgi:hypothetical protein
MEFNYAEPRQVTNVDECYFARLSTDAVIITQQALKDQEPIASFIPNVRMDPNNASCYDEWWVFSEGCRREMLEVLGFKIESLARHMHMCTGREHAGNEECLTIVARRVQ